MRFDVLTIFPGFFSGFLENGILRRAIAEGRVEFAAHDLRAFTHDRHRTVDDRPFGGGEGMVLKPGPLAEAFAALGIAPKAVRAGRDAGTGQGATSVLPQAAAEEGGASQAAETGHGTSETALGQEQGLKPDAFFSAPCGTTEVVPWLQSSPALSFAADCSFADRSSADCSSADCEVVPRGQAEARPADGVLAPVGASAQYPQRARVILLSAQGRPFTQAVARELARLDRIVLVCGRYEGVDERVNELYCDEELSIGDYVLSGGELAAAVVVDAVMRLLPGVLGNEASSEFESFGAADAEIETDVEGVPRSQHGAGGLLDYPHYTRPAEFAGLRVPEVLLNGDHSQIRRWRREQQLRKTLANRPDLLERAALSAEDRKLLAGLRNQGR
ncbi:MAG: tRNA (guanine(37)-N(1))-methyltransferase [Terracidiphilus sp.]